MRVFSVMYHIHAPDGPVCGVYDPPLNNSALRTIDDGGVGAHLLAAHGDGPIHL